MERKDFIKKSFALCGMALIPAGLLESCSKTQNFSGPANVNFTLDLTAAANAPLNSVGGAVAANGIIIIRLGTTTFNALSDTCTHAGCTLGYNKGSATLVCPCHGGAFNPASGVVVGGPPPSALNKYNITQSGNILTITS